MKDKALKTDEKPKGAEDVCEEQDVKDCEYHEMADDSPVVETYNNGLLLRAAMVKSISGSVST